MNHCGSVCDAVGVLKEETVFLKQFQNTSIRTERTDSLVDSLTVDIFCHHLYVLSFALNKAHGILLA